MTNPGNWQNIPDQLRLLPSWCVAAPDKSPYSVTGHRASVTSPHTWASFDAAADTAIRWGNDAGVGFVLQAGQGLVCIDLDVKADTPPEHLARFKRIIASFNSYTERSTSGRGFHIWVRANLTAGRRRDGVEVYGQERFIVCTGNVYHDAPIAERQELIDILFEELAGADTVQADSMEELEPTEDDATVWRRAREAENAGKFIALCDGDWGALGYPSQSEADLSLLSMLCFYSKSNAQVRRMFRQTGLGRREKATKNDRYIDRTLRAIRARQAREAAAEAAGNDHSAQLAEMLRAQAARNAPVQATPATATPTVTPHQHPDIDTLYSIPNNLPYPPGFVGEVARWFYSISPRPVHEVSILSSLALFAGMFGRAVQVNGSGVNLYLVLIAQSGVGKEALHSNISKLLTLTQNIPGISKRVDFTDYASGPALAKAFNDGERNSFLNVNGEWGRKLQRMGKDGDSGPMNSLRTVMTNLYQKSGVGTVVGGIGYSDAEKSVKSLDGVAYSMLGETTPDTFYDSLTATMMQDGFMSRFIIVEYRGDRPPLNEMTDVPMPEQAFNYICSLGMELDRLGPSGFYNVRMDLEAAQMLSAFDKECDARINSSKDESWRQMWNRAHLKALKIASILAAADNLRDPLVTPVYARWALDLVLMDIRSMTGKIAEGDVGEDDTSRERKLLTFLREYLLSTPKKGYDVPESMRLAGIVPRKYLQLRSQRVNAFANHRFGRIRALEEAINNLIHDGYLEEVAKEMTVAQWAFRGKCYRIVSEPTTMTH